MLVQYTNYMVWKDTLIFISLHKYNINENNSPVVYCHETNPTSLSLSIHWDRDKMAAIFQTTFSNAFSWMKISSKFVPQGPKNSIPSLVQIVALRRSGVKALYEQMMA